MKASKMMWLLFQLALPLVGMGLPLAAWVGGCEIVFPYPWLTVCVLVLWATVPTAGVFYLDGKIGTACEVLAILSLFCSLAWLFCLLFGGGWLVLIGILCCICTAVTAWHVLETKWMRVLSAVLGGLSLLPIAFVGFWVFIFSMFSLSEQTVLQTAVSPDGTYLAQLIDDDQGAMGGATYVTVFSADKSLNFLVFALQGKPQVVYQGGWGEGFDKPFVWIDENTLRMGDKIIDVTE